MNIFAALGILTSIFKQVRGSNDAETHRVTAKQGPRTRKKALMTRLSETIGAKKESDGTPRASGRTPRAAPGPPQSPSGTLPGHPDGIPNPL